MIGEAGQLVDGGWDIKAVVQGGLAGVSTEGAAAGWRVPGWRAGFQEGRDMNFLPSVPNASSSPPHQSYRCRPCRRSAAPAAAQAPTCSERRGGRKHRRDGAQGSSGHQAIQAGTGDTSRRRQGEGGAGTIRIAGVNSSAATCSGPSTLVHTASHLNPHSHTPLTRRACQRCRRPTRNLIRAEFWPCPHPPPWLYRPCRGQNGGRVNGACVHARVVQAQGKRASDSCPTPTEPHCLAPQRPQPAGWLARLPTHLVSNTLADLMSR